MILLLGYGCTEPEVLARVAEAHASSLVDEAEMAIALFVSVAAVVAEPCGADTLDGYTLTGQGFRAFHVNSPSVELSGTGERTYNYGTVAFLDDVGELALTSDEARRQWTAGFAGHRGTFTAQYTTGSCDVDDVGVTTLSSLTGNAAYASDGSEEQELTVNAEGGASLEWSPATAGVPTAGRITWRVNNAKTEIALDDAAGIDPVERGWPGVAAGSTWSAGVVIPLP
ncbi:MAG: hypothetical protein EXR71_13845 [Myxococcales bacterium]|nr:hypothetical protein [Myxococcales bacterium]